MEIFTGIWFDLDGNHLHNLQVLKTGKGEMRSVRTTEDKTATTYPCHLCHAWLLPTLFKKHKCPLSETGEKPSIAKSRRLLKDAETEESAGMKRQGWELCSFTFRTHRSFPFFFKTQRFFKFFFRGFGDLWNPKNEAFWKERMPNPVKRILEELRNDEIGLAIKKDPALMRYIRFRVRNNLYFL